MEIIKYADLYGWELCLKELKRLGYLIVAYREKTIPDGGSRAFSIHKLNDKISKPVTGKIIHKDGSVTLKTALGNLRFWK